VLALAGGNHGNGNGHVRVRVVSVGTGGGNAVQHMISSGIRCVEYICANTDAQALTQRTDCHKIQLGQSLTGGAGVSGNPQLGREAALESTTAIREALRDADMVFVVVCTGGGTGTGAAPVIAGIAKELGAFTVAVATRPFHWEDIQRGSVAEFGLAELKEHVDCLIRISNDKLLAPEHAARAAMFKKADDVLYFAVKDISAIILEDGMITLDFADVRDALSAAGLAHMGMGVADGKNRASEAARRALSDPLFEGLCISKAKRVVYVITAHPDDITGDEILKVGTIIGDAIHPESNVIMGMVYDEKLGDTLRITLIASEAKFSDAMRDDKRN